MLAAEIVTHVSSAWTEYDDVKQVGLVADVAVALSAYVVGVAKVYPVALQLEIREENASALSSL